MISLIINVVCNDCQEVLKSKEPFTSASEARSYAAGQGWQSIFVHRVSLDFCPDCQETSNVAVGAGTR